MTINATSVHDVSLPGAWSAISFYQGARGEVEQSSIFKNTGLEVRVQEDGMLEMKRFGFSTKCMLHSLESLSTRRAMPM